jgi:hypothetical protein
MWPAVRTETNTDNSRTRSCNLENLTKTLDHKYIDKRVAPNGHYRSIVRDTAKLSVRCITIPSGDRGAMCAVAEVVAKRHPTS